jgi:hypothetical protein
VRAQERRLTAVPWPVFVFLAAALALQVWWASNRGAPTARAEALPAPPSLAVLNVVSLGQPEVLARVLMLWLQAFDYQPGISISFRDLDYARVEAWLARILDLDPQFQYPLLAASRLYGEVYDPEKQRRMLAFVAARFDEDPARRWQWLAHAVYLAKHRLGDLDYALSLARQLANADAGAAIPNWARQMQIFVLEDMGELESAKVLLGGLLDSGEISDPRERWFLSQRLAELEDRVADEGGD